MFTKKKARLVSTGIAMSVLMAVAAGNAHAEAVVVVSSKSSASALTKDQASEIFLGKLPTLPGAGQAVLVDQAEGSAVRNEFYSKVTGKSQPQMKAYWAKLICSGKGQPPKEASDSAAVKKLLAENPNMVGYIDKSAVDGSVKVLLNVE